MNVPWRFVKASRYTAATIGVWRVHRRVSERHLSIVERQQPGAPTENARDRVLWAA